ncbi:kinase-like protein [Rhizopogon vinicolor AM-OR11-026]|uniref:Kinase-like protein n=1 Tax=Rhizopogon vinicolor AM-OR11-026 TaxID=1314800 RepID=A0A1B7MIK3_9AGAM|nr:kinase-like protein [Rhizopogon vinicolor AM-OR11-026]
MGDDDLSVGDIEDARDLPEDLTPFITRTILDPIGVGGYGDVWKCSYDAGGISTFVAVKAFRFPENWDSQRMKRNIGREIGILMILRHNNIVALLGRAKGFGKRPEMDCLVSPWMPNSTLHAYLELRQNNLTALERSRLLEDVSAGLRYLHSVPLMHGDITAANIMIDEGENARLIDFGLSSIIRPLLGQSHLVMTSIRHGAIRYAAPELVASDGVRDLPLQKVDVYSFGCVMLQILSGRLPWSEIQSETLITVSIYQGHRPQRPNGDPSIIDSDWDFIQKCLRREPELRPSADEVFDFVIHRLSSSGSSRPSEQAVETGELHPTTDKIFQICPRFRILVMGKVRIESVRCFDVSLLNSNPWYLDGCW